MNQKLHRIGYIHIGDFPSEQVHTIQVMRMCEGLQQAGYAPVLIGRAGSSLGDSQNDPTDLFSYYGIQTEFEVKLLHFPTFVSWPRPVRVIYFFLYSFYALLQARKLQLDILYTRSFYTAVLATLLRMPFIIEEHAPPLRDAHTWLCRRYYASSQLRGAVFISQALKAIYADMGLLSICQAPTLVAHDAAARSQIQPVKPIRLEAGDPIRVGYVGSLLAGRGIELILAAARSLPDLEFCLIGGSSDQIERLATAASPNVVWRGFVAPGRLAEEFAQLDILLMPYQEDTATHAGVHSARWMSPLKMFEYMATGIPLIASDLPVLREVLEHERNCLLAPPKDVTAWTGAIRRLASDVELRGRLAKAAHTDVTRQHNWETRATKIMRMVGQLRGATQ